MSDYVERNEHGTLRVVGTRTSLASVVHAYWSGDAAEEIAQNFPSLSLEKIHGALAYYLANRASVDAELKALDAKWDTSISAAQQANQALREKLLAARNARAAS